MNTGVSPLPVFVPPKPDKFFAVEISGLAGLNHMIRALSWLVREAVSLQRTPVVLPPRLNPKHNAGHAVKSTWDQYVDLDQVAIRLAGKIIPVTVVQRQAALEGDSLPVLTVPPERMITAAENAHYTLIIRQSVHGLKLPGGHDGLPGYPVLWRPAPGVVDRAEGVIRQLGEYHAMHVRRGDRLGHRASPRLAEETEPRRIQEVLDRNLPAGATIYILTDESDRSFFDPLRTRQRIFQFFDFPELRTLVDSPAPDNFLLYAIEKLIFDRAKLQIYTFADPGGRARVSLSQDAGWS